MVGHRRPNESARTLGRAREWTGCTSHFHAICPGASARTGIVAVPGLVWLGAVRRRAGEGKLTHGGDESSRG